ncbi:hypothetical protein NMY22_g3630 [Coprinellus aureogranulatus]|nr:hypothetical protein NMY22_g3630 [Coprinellus aureogranulatus]
MRPIRSIESIFPSFPHRRFIMKSSTHSEPLVDDVLVDIFLYLLAPPVIRQSFRHVLAVSQVCRQWRTVALSCPELWRSFPFLTGEHGNHREMFTKLILDRSGPLSVDIGWQDPCRPLGALLAEFRHIHRCRSYVLHGGDGLKYPLAFQLQALRRTVPVLEHITLRTNSREPCFLDPFFMNHLPMLKRVRLENVVIPFHCIRAPMLQHVDYAFHPDASRYMDDPSTLPCVFKLVSAFPNLTTLRLRLFHEQEDLGNNVIEMPLLRSLELSMRALFVEPFLRRVCMPRCVEVSVDIHPRPGGYNGNGTMVNWVEQVTKAVINHAVLPLGLDQGRGYELIFSCLELYAVEAVIHPFNEGIGARATDAFLVRTSANEFRETRGPSIVRGVVEGFLPLLGSVKLVKVVKPYDPPYPIDYPNIFREFMDDRSVLFLYPDGKPHVHVS